jgi:hypothetical protein
MLQDASTALATLDPAKNFGESAFGPLRFRIIDADGTKGDWQPLATLVRLPQFQTLKCPWAADQPCKLTGANLFLVDAVSGDAQFAHPVQVPDGFPGNVLPVPHPASGELYVKLRDDPSVVNQVSLVAENVGPKPTPPAEKPHAAKAPDQADGKPRPDYVSPNPQPSSNTPPSTPAPNNPAPDKSAPATVPPPANPPANSGSQNQPAQNSTPPAANPQPQAADQSTGSVAAAPAAQPQQ